MKRARDILFPLAILVVLVESLALISAYKSGETWYLELKSWDTVLAAAITITGLIVAAIIGGKHVSVQIKANARDARRQHDREQITAALSIGATLAGEINAVIKEVGVKIDLVDQFYTDDAEDPDPIKVSATLDNARQSIPRLRSYDNLDDRIGLLGPPVVEKLAGIHVELESFREYFFGDLVESVLSEDTSAAALTLENFRVNASLIKDVAQIAYDTLKARLAELEAERAAIEAELDAL